MISKITDFQKRNTGVTKTRGQRVRFRKGFGESLLLPSVWESRGVCYREGESSPPLSTEDPQNPKASRFNRGK